MLEEITKIEQNAINEISSAKNENELNEIRVKIFGKKGYLTNLLRSLGTLSPEERPKAGKIINELKDKLTAILDNKKNEFTTIIKKSEIDLTLPGRTIISGAIHPINIVIDEVVRIFTSMGFSIADGPEMESEYYNLDALNFPPDHPARDMQDTFYLRKAGYLLRTHTSPVQIRTMESQRPPVRIIAPGKCFRRDAIDPTHFICFHQVEGLYIDNDVTLADLKGVLTILAQDLFETHNVKIRFRPHFFPFTEPSVEYDFSCVFCNGKGCRICKNSGWIEISGAGMVDPEVLKNVGYDPDKWQGYAFGMGIERIAMLKFGIDDIRLLYENDIRFLSQFRGIYP